LELAKYLSLSSDVILVAKTVSAGFFYGIPALSEKEFTSDRLKSTDILLQISRGDYVMNGVCNVIAQHGPHHILGLKGSELKLVDAVICVSKFSKKQQRGYGIPISKLRVVKNGIDTSVFSLTSEKRLTNSFIYAGHIISYKGIVVALRAFMEVFDHHPEASFHFYGRNMGWNKNDHGESWLRERGYLDEMSRIDWNRVSKDCPGINYGGEVTQDELSSLFNRTAFVICCSVIPETFGLVSLEAQACGCIPIIANHGGYPETIMHLTPKFIFEPGNHRSLAVTMLQAISKNPDVLGRSKMAKTASEFSWNKTNSQITSIVKHIERRKKILDRFSHILG